MIDYSDHNDVWHVIDPAKINEDHRIQYHWSSGLGEECLFFIFNISCSYYNLFDCQTNPWNFLIFCYHLLNISKSTVLGEVLTADTMWLKKLFSIKWPSEDWDSSKLSISNVLRAFIYFSHIPFCLALFYHFSLIFTLSLSSINIVVPIS